jgi:hypothetical protein
VNAANVDNSYKWAGGGFLSNVTDLISFGNAMLYSYQAGELRIRLTDCVVFCFLTNDIQI